MVFLTLGNQNFEFSRLLNKIEELIEKGIIKSVVVAQIGHTSFSSSLIKTMDFLDKEEFENFISKSDYVISHGGTGSIISCLRMGKKVIVAPRLKKHGEHIDDHQLEITKAFAKKNLIIALNNDFLDFENILLNIDSISLEKFISNNRFFNKELIKIIEG